MPYATEVQTGLPWNATACFPVHPDPVAAGEPCQWFEGLFSGHDNCELGAFCLQWSDEEPGECRDLCMLDEGMPDEWESYYCSDGSTIPVMCQECFCWCDPVCNPLAPDCEEGQGCYLQGDGFDCMPDASGKTGAAGDPCEFVNACDPGLFCLDASATPGCESGIGCCSPACDITQPNTCPGPGQTCQAWYQEGDALLGLENLGVCAL